MPLLPNTISRAGNDVLLNPDRVDQGGVLGMPAQRRSGATTRVPRTVLQWLQALRGIGALMVLFFHMQPHWDLVAWLKIAGAATQWGFVGVDIFFALSGFVVYLSAQRAIPQGGTWPFIKKRLLRIYLGYWPVLLLTAAVTVFLYREDLPAIKKMIFSALLLYPNIWDNWLPIAWSLSLEIYFYVWVGLIALLPQRLQLKAICGAIALLALWGAGWILLAPGTVFTGQQPLRYGLTGLGIEFLAGAMVAHIYLNRPHLLDSTRSLLALGTCLVIFGFWLGTQSQAFANIEILRTSSFGCVGLGALLLALALESTPWRPPKWLGTIGDASYSLYLLHFLLLGASGRIRVHSGLVTDNTLHFFLLALPVIIVLASVAWYRCIEKPLMKAVL